MKKGIKNDKVLRAITLGLATMMALSNPATVLAEELDTGVDPVDPGYSDIEGGIADAAQDAQTDAATADAAADAAADTAANDAATETVGDEVYGVDVDAINNALVTDDNVTIPNIIKVDDVNSIDTDLVEAENVDVLATNAADKADSSADAAIAVADAASKEAKKAVDTATSLVDTINNATNMHDAKEAYDALVALEDETAKSIEEKQAAYDALKAAYDEALANVKLFEEAYDTAVNSAALSAEKAMGDLLTAQAALETLKDALKAAKDSVDSYSNAALEIIAKQQELAGRDSLNWQEENKLFNIIMTNYYVPEVLADGQKVSDIKVERKQGRDNDSQNYFVVTYKDENGNVVEKYFNFKMDGSSKSEIVIFEKRKNEVDASDAIKKDADTLLYTDGVEVDSYKYSDGSTLKNYDQDDFDADADAGNIKSFDEENGLVTYEDGTVAYKKGETVTDSLPEGTEAGTKYDEETDTTTETQISEKETSYVVDEKGNVHEQVKQDVTTYTYTGKSFGVDADSDDAYATDEAAKAAAEAKAKELMDENDKGLDITVTDTTKYKTDVEYVDTFADVIDLSHTETYYNGLFIKSDAEQKNMEELSDDIAKYTQGAVYTDENGVKKYIISAKVGTPETERSDNWLWDGMFDDWKTEVKISVTTAKIDTEEITVTDDALVGYGFNSNLTKEVKEWNWKKLKYENVTVPDEDAIAASRQAAIDAYVAAEAAKAGENANNYWSNVEYKDGKILIDTVAKKTFEGTEKDNKADSENEFDATNKLILSKDTTENTTYGYEAAFLDFKDKTDETVVLEDTEYKKLAGVVEQNKKYKDGEILLDENDDQGLKKFLDDANKEKTDLQDKYERLIKETEAAEDTVKDAEDKVKELQAEIENLKNREDKYDELKGLEDELKKAEAELKDAQDDLDDLKDKVDEGEDGVDDLRKRLTPTDEERPNDDDPSEEPSSDDSTPVVPVVPTAPTEVVPGDVVTSITPAEVLAAGPAAGVAGARVERGGVTEEGDVKEESGDTVKTKEIVKAKVDNKKVAKADAKKTGVTTLVDEEVPLAAIPYEQNMNWWWLVLIAILGGTGYAMYKNHMKKKEEQARAAEIKKED